MMTTPDHPVSCVRRPPRQIFFGFFWGILGASAVLALLILLLPGSVFLAFSNYLQILTAFVVVAAFACAWLRCGGTPAYPYAAVEFGLWGVSNIAWYLIVLTGQRALVFPSLIDLGMIASFLLLAVAFRKGFPKTMVPRQLLSGFLAFASSSRPRSLSRQG